MKYIFTVQGEGRGHLTQAIAMEEILTAQGHEVTEVLVGKSDVRELPDFFRKRIKAPVYRFDSPNFQPSRDNRRNRLGRSIACNILKLPTYMHSINFIREHIRNSGADAVINFYELLTGLTYAFYQPAVPQISIGHQYLFLHGGMRLPHRHRHEFMLLNLFTRLTCCGAARKLALSFRHMPDDDNENITVVPPLLRREVFGMEATQGDYIHGYMVNAGFAENVAEWHRRRPEVKLSFFWDKKNAGKTTVVDSTLTFHQLDDREFLHQLAGCRAYATTAGFESVCEAMYFGKPVLMVPAHIEQDCNAFDAARNGAGIASDTFNLDSLTTFAEGFTPDHTFRQWAESAARVICGAIEKYSSPHATQHTGHATPTSTPPVATAGIR